MAKLTKAIIAEADKLPRLMMCGIVERKLRAQGIELEGDELAALVDRLLENGDGTFTFGEGNEALRNIDLIFDEEDSKEIERTIANFTEEIPAMVERVIETSGANLFSSLREAWQVEGALQQFDADGFRERLEDRWGEGLDLLRMLLTCAREIGTETDKRHRRSRSRRYANRRFVLTRLHLRACQVADEVITLLENGFADGALARWRTLHEIDVTATVIEDGDEDLALRFIEHDVVEVKKHADDYDEKQVPMGYAPVAPRERKRIEKAYADVIARYGSEFRSEYGWAAKHLNSKRPTFKDLQARANQSGMNTYYKLANFQVHAGARAMFFRLGSLGREMPIAGRSNAGLMEPGQNTAYTLVRITGALVGRLRNLDSMVEMKSILHMRDAIPPAFHRAANRLRRDEARFQKERREKSGGKPAKR
ncbi:MAG TPA: DUF5677 domain-containing protein [Caulobacter sp.]|nr:DUF5677 domain-containing protein [Caulobacter sp.]